MINESTIRIDCKTKTESEKLYIQYESWQRFSYLLIKYQCSFLNLNQDSQLED